MKIGFLGLGKLGLSCALAIESQGHDVVGYDLNPTVQEYVQNKKIPYKEEGVNQALINSNIKLVTLSELVKFSEIIFVGVQTPHHEKYEGIKIFDDERELTVIMMIDISASSFYGTGDNIKSDLNDVDESNLLNNSDLAGVENLPNVIEQEDKLDAKKNERERLGSVNLRADEETEQYKVTIKKMEKDREDLITGISKLRSSINELNQKGRERLLDAFEKVNRKFNEVYTKLFNGGTAKLELVDSDDPLEAGLELLVSPPGKRLQSISLLSGGEQALTALSLVFAVFLTSPAPICVLDEVDAPLDDANVTRFCSLLEELIKITETKFIIITHHALTMSRMDRLYGVTMPEKGISQLVSVDLQKAEELVA